MVEELKEKEEQTKGISEEIGKEYVYTRECILCLCCSSFTKIKENVNATSKVVCLHYSTHLIETDAKLT